MNQQELVKKINEIYHNWEAKYYLERHPEIFEREKDNWQKFASKFFINKKAKKILDIGCGTGFVAQTIGKYLNEQDEFFCSDISSGMLEIAEKNLSSNNFKNKFFFLKGSIEELNFEPNSFDFIIMNSVLHHLPDIEIFFKEVNRVLKINGKLIIFHEPNKKFFQNWFLRNNFLLLQRMKKIIFTVFLSSRSTAGSREIRLDPDPALREERGRDDREVCLYGKEEKQSYKENIFDQINNKLIAQELIIEKLSIAEIKQFIDYNSPTGSGKINKNKGFDGLELRNKYLPNFTILEFTTYNYLGKINQNFNFVLNFYNFLLSRILPKSGSSFGAVLEKTNDTRS